MARETVEVVLVTCEVVLVEELLGWVCTWLCHHPWDWNTQFQNGLVSRPLDLPGRPRYLLDFELRGFIEPSNSSWSEEEGGDGTIRIPIRTKEEIVCCFFLLNKGAMVKEGWKTHDDTFVTHPETQI